MRNLIIMLLFGVVTEINLFGLTKLLLLVGVGLFMYLKQKESLRLGQQVCSNFDMLVFYTSGDSAFGNSNGT